VLGSVGAVLLHRLGGSIGAILRENYRSVIYMERLNEAVERIDSSFHIALAGREDDARQQYEGHWKQFYENIEKENENITLPSEGELVQELTALGEDYHRCGDSFFERRSREERDQIYFQRPGGLLDLFQKIKSVAIEILRINQQNMEEASQEARDAARWS